MSVKLNKKEALARNVLINKYLCDFITKRWLLNYKGFNGEVISHNKYAKLCNLSASTISKIKEEEGYNIPISTLYSICQKEKESLSDFFKEFEKQYGVNILH